MSFLYALLSAGHLFLTKQKKIFVHGDFEKTRKREKTREKTRYPSAKIKKTKNLLKTY